jgi:hypothetical protein
MCYLSHPGERAMAHMDAAEKELSDLLAQAMQQPGVADLMSIYEAARQTTDAAQGSMGSLQPQWLYQVTNSSSS